MATKFQQTVYEFTIQGKVEILTKIKAIAKFKYGVYKAVGAFHSKDDEPHTHFCIALRDKPNFTSKSLNSYFNLPSGSTPPRPVKSGGRTKIQKLNKMYSYYTDEISHPGELIEPPVCYKYDPNNVKTEKRPKKISTMTEIYEIYINESKGAYQQWLDADISRKAYICQNMVKIKDMFYQHDLMMREAKPPEFPLESFKESEVKQSITSHDFTKREHGQKKKCLVLTGESNTGKTKLAKAVFKNPLIVRHKDKLKQFDPVRHDGIVFDDMSFANYSRETVLALMDMDDDADINVKNSMVTIPAGTPRIFTTNRPMYATLSGWDTEYDPDNSFLPKPLFVKDPSPNYGAEGAKLDDPAITNRFVLITVTEKLYA